MNVDVGKPVLLEWDQEDGEGGGTMSLLCFTTILTVGASSDLKDSKFAHEKEPFKIC